MNKIIFSLFCLAIWSIFGCQKGELPQENTPVFELSGKSDGVDFTWQAGVNNVFMKPDFGVFSNDPTVLKHYFSGELGLILTPDSVLAPKIELILIQNEGNSNFESVLRPREVEFSTSILSGSELGISYQSLPSPVIPYDDFSIWINGETFTNFEGILESIDSQFVGFANILAARDSFVVEQSILINMPEKQITQMQFSQQNGLLKAEVLGGLKAESFIWNTGDTSESVDVGQSFQKLSVIVLLENGASIIGSTYANFPFGSPFFANVQLDFVNLNQNLIPNHDFSSVIVNYYNETGQVFSSEFADQNADSFFKILSVEDFPKSENGVSAQKLGVEFSAVLSNPTTGQQKILQNVKGNFAFGHPD